MTMTTQTFVSTTPFFHLAIRIPLRQHTFLEVLNAERNVLHELYCCVDRTSKPKYHEHFTLSDLRPFIDERQQATIEEFDEEFLDTPDFQLMKRKEGSCWLRRRNKNDWVFKFAVKSQDGVLEYEEEKNYDAIMSHLNGLGIASIPEFCYARFKTIRYSFLVSEDISLWVDVSEFADEVFYAVGTVEVPLRPGLVELRLNDVKDLYGVSFSAASKIVAFLYYFSPSLFASINPPESIAELDENSFDCENLFEEREARELVSDDILETDFVRSLRESQPELFEITF